MNGKNCCQRVKFSRPVKVINEMNDRTHRSATLERLEQVLDAYGGDPIRWPDNERDVLLALVRQSPKASARLQEAEVLDQILSHGDRWTEPVSCSMANRLADGVMEAIATRETMAAEASGQVTVDSIRDKTLDDVVTLDSYRSGANVGRQPKRNSWPAAALMAASLVFGVYLGASGVLTPVFDEFAEFTGGVNTSDTELAELSFGPDFALEEELL